MLSAEDRQRCDMYVHKNEDIMECSLCGAVIYCDCIYKSWTKFDVPRFCPACGCKINNYVFNSDMTLHE